MNGSGEMTNEELLKRTVEKYGLNISEEEQKKIVEELDKIEKDSNKMVAMSFSTEHLKTIQPITNAKGEIMVGRFLGA